MIELHRKLNSETLIKRGGGKGPDETRQPVLYKVPIPVEVFLQDKKNGYCNHALLIEELFYFLSLCTLKIKNSLKTIKYEERKK